MNEAMLNGLLYVAGLLTVPALSVILRLFRVTKVAIHDTAQLARKGELKEGRSKWNWVWILPKSFIFTWWETLIDDMQGKVRVL